MKRSNKKGIGLDNAIPLMIIIAVGAIVFTGFKLVQNKNESEMLYDILYDIQKQKDLIEGQKLLVEFITTTQNGKIVSDSLRDSYVKKDFGFMQKDITNFFNSRLGHIVWEFLVVDSEGEKLYSTDNGANLAGCLGNSYYTGSLIIPTQDSYIISKMKYCRDPYSGYNSVFS